MIIVLNLNASVDKKYKIDDISKGKVIRASSVVNTAGGKGIHVANVANILGENTLTTGFLGGSTGKFIEEKLIEMGIKGDFVKVEGDTRECLAFITNDLTQTEILEPGPNIRKEELCDFIKKYSDLIKTGTVICASGSVPRNVPTDIYSKLIELAKDNGKKFLLDTSGELLLKSIEAKPFFIKPNQDEIKMITGSGINSEEDILKDIFKLNEFGISCVAVSLGKEGSLVGFNGKQYKIKVPKIEAVNPVGSGDSFVGGFAVGIERQYSIKDTIALAAACGTANAMEEETGFVRKETVKSLIDKIKILEL